MGKQQCNHITLILFRLHTVNVGKLVTGNSYMTPCTPLAVISLLEHHSIPIACQRVNDWQEHGRGDAIVGALHSKTRHRHGVSHPDKGSSGCPQFIRYRSCSNGRSEHLFKAHGSSRDARSLMWVSIEWVSSPPRPRHHSLGTSILSPPRRWQQLSARCLAEWDH